MKIKIRDLFNNNLHHEFIFINEERTSSFSLKIPQFSSTQLLLNRSSVSMEWQRVQRKGHRNSTTRWDSFPYGRMQVGQEG